MILCVPAVLLLLQAPVVEQPVRFGIVFHLPSRTADAIWGHYAKGSFVSEVELPRLPMHRALVGTASTGRAVRVVIDSENPEPEVTEGQYKVRLFPLVADTNAAVLFWDGAVSARVAPSDSVSLDPAIAAALEQRGRELVRLALKEADDGMVAQYDSVEFAHPRVLKLRESPGSEVVNYQVLFKHSGKVVDERASLCFLVDPQSRRILFSTFGHPEWGPNAEHVFALYPRLFFKITGDPRTYLLAVHYGAWEAFGIWVVLDAQSGKSLTLSLTPLPN